jgi:hypothetical protein
MPAMTDPWTEHVEMVEQLKRLYAEAGEALARNDFKTALARVIEMGLVVQEYDATSSPAVIELRESLQQLPLSPATKAALLEAFGQKPTLQ